MKWEQALDLIGNQPIFHSSIFAAGSLNLKDLRRQLSRWVKNGRLIKIRRGVYMLSDTYRKETPHPFVIANKMKHASYVSLQSALAHYGMIPEYVPSVTSATTGRPEIVDTSIGSYIFKHIKNIFFHSYENIDLGKEQSAFIAIPEKALLDLLYLTPGSDKLPYLRELRLQKFEILDIDKLIRIARETESKKLFRAVNYILLLMRRDEVS